MAVLDRAAVLNQEAVLGRAAVLNQEAVLDRAEEPRAAREPEAQAACPAVEHGQPVCRAGGQGRQDVWGPLAKMDILQRIPVPADIVIWEWTLERSFPLDGIRRAISSSVFLA